MATTTPNYGWTVPTSTDLVKDGATAIETLGDAIDASMNTALGTKKAGMVLLNTTSFSGVASQSVNDVFSATYDRYLITTNISSASANIDILFRLRVSGSDATGSNYSYAGSGWRATNAQFTPVSTGTTSFDIGRGGVAYVDAARLDVVNPFLAVKTVVLGQYGAVDSVSTFVNPFAGNHDLTTSYTGFTIFPNTGTFSGSVSVYGYNK